MTAFLTIILVLLSLFIVLLILLQRTSGGMGSALGGGAADQVFGGGSAAVLTKWTVWGILLFFLLSFALYLRNQHNAGAPEPVAPNQTVAPKAPSSTGNATGGTPNLQIPPANPGSPSSPPPKPEANASVQPDSNSTPPKGPVTPSPQGGE